MATLWNEVQTLGGQTLWTVRGNGFDIASVSDDLVRIILHSSGRVCFIPKGAFDQAEAQGLDTSEVSPSLLRKAGVSEFQPAYIAAIIRAVRTTV